MRQNKPLRVRVILYTLRDGTNLIQYWYLVQNWRKFIDQISDRRHRSTSTFYVHQSNRHVHAHSGWGVCMGSICAPLSPTLIYLFVCFQLSSNAPWTHSDVVITVNHTDDSYADCCVWTIQPSPFLRWSIVVFDIVQKYFKYSGCSLWEPAWVFNQQSKDISSK